MLSDYRCLVFPWEGPEIPSLEADSVVTSQGLKGGGSSCFSSEEASLRQEMWRHPGGRGWRVVAYLPCLLLSMDRVHLLALRNSRPSFVDSL